jgi:hypothetical protein
MPRTCGYCATNLYDQFGIYVNPSTAVWNLVDGGQGQIQDPVDDAASVTSLWTFGGAPDLSAAAGSYTATIAVTQGAPQTLSVVLDTATGRSDDTTLASWGSITNVQLVPFVGSTARPALTLSWNRSPFDPDGGTGLSVDAGGADIQLAARQFGAPARTEQPEGIWGAAAVLPGRDASGQAYTSYRLSFDYDLHTHDLRGSVGEEAAAPPPAPTPLGEQVSLQWTALVGVALALFAHRRKHSVAGGL